MTSSVQFENYNCTVVGRSVTVAVLKVALPGLRPVVQLKDCNGARVCKRFGYPPSPGRFSSPVWSGCPYHDGLHAAIRSG
jgi:hypothetical protein